MKRLVSLASFLMVLISFSSLAEAVNYQAYYGDLDGDGIVDIYITPPRKFVPINPGPASMVPVGQPAFVVWGAGAGGTTLSPATSEDYRIRDLSRASLIFGDVDGDGLDDAVVVFSGDTYNLLIVSDFNIVSPGGVTLALASLNGEPVSPAAQYSLVDISGSSTLDLVLTPVGSTASYGFSNNGAGAFSEPLLLVGDGSPESPFVLPSYVVGATALDVDAVNGASLISIPLDIAPGPAGVQPQLSLTYSSGSDYGQAGMGFSLSGMSVIGRCGASYLREGFRKQVMGSDSDYACLDGNRLVLVSGGYWQDGSHYRLESEQFSDVVYRKPSSGQSWFEVRQKNGDVYLYGDSESPSQIIGGHGQSARWPLMQVNNRFDQGYKIRYKDNSAGLFPEAISYTSGVGGNPVASVDFEYEADNHWKKAYIEGKPYDSGWRIKSITNRISGVVHREYHLFYDLNPVTNRALLSSVLECAAGLQCLGETKIGWDRSEQVSLESVALARAFPEVSQGTVLAGQWVNLLGDGTLYFCSVIHDGNQLISSGCHNPQTTSWHLVGVPQMSFVSLFLEPYSGPPFLVEDKDTWNKDPSWVDVNLDGVIDFCFSRPGNGAEIVLECRASSNGSPLYGSPFSSFFIRSLELEEAAEKYSAKIFWADVFGSSSDEVCVEYRIVGATRTKCFSLSGPDLQVGMAKVMHTRSDVTVVDSLRWVDVNSDGLTDACWIASAYNWLVCGMNSEFGQEIVGSTDWVMGLRTFSSPSSGEIGSAGSGTSFFNNDYFDFNGDGYLDYCRIVRTNVDGADGYRAACVPSTGYGWGQEYFSGFVKVEQAKATLFSDANGDGWTDWCLELQSELRCYRNDGGEFSDEYFSLPLADLSYATDYSHSRAFVDLFANGVPHYCITPSSKDDGFSAHYIQCLGAGSQSEVSGADEAVLVRNAFGLEYQFEYTDGSNPAVYQRTARQGTQGQLFAIGAGMRLVSGLRVADGFGGYLESEYFYRNAGYFPNEFGSVGFDYVRSRVEGGKTQQETWFLQDPSTHRDGLVSATRSSILLDSGQYQIVSEVANQWITSIYHGPDSVDYPASSAWNKNATVGLRFGVSIQSSTSSDYELDGSLVRTVTATNEYDQFGNVVSQTTVTSGVDQSFTQSLANEYSNSVSDWIIGRLTASESTRSGVYKGEPIPAQSRNSAWEHFASGPQKGMVQKEIIEPDKPEFRKETVYTYTAQGQVESVAISVPGAPVRTIQYSYDALGWRVLSETNSLGHTVSYQYHPVSGLQTAIEDPNGLTVHREYDAFGRLITETTPGQQVSHTQIRRCESGCPQGAIYYVESWAVSPMGEVLSAPAREFTDLLGRVLETHSTGFGGETVIARVEYDAEGELHRQSKPYIYGEDVHWDTVQSRDESGRVIAEIRASGLEVLYGYDGLRSTETKIWDAGSSTSEAEVDVLGNLRRAVDAGGRTITYQYDAFGHLLQATLPDGYVVSSVYDDLGRRVAHSDPSVGTLQYGYDGHDQIVLQENANGERICQAYDVLGRMTGRTDNYQPTLSWNDALTSALGGCAGQAFDTVWAYDTTVGAGRLKSVTHQGGYSETPAYDALGRVVSVNVVVDGQTYTSSNEYDPDTGRLDVSHMPGSGASGGISVEYRYNPQGFLEEVGPVNSQVYYWKTNEVDAWGVSSDQLLSNGAIQVNRVSDPTSGLQKHIRAKGAFSSYWNIQNETYEWNARGIMQWRSEEIVPEARHLKEEFGYDGLDRLTATTLTNMSQPTLSYSQSVQYDAAGNITSRSDVGIYSYGQSCVLNGQTIQPGPHAVTEITGSRAAQYCYDAAGNMRSGAGRQIDYTAFSKPSLISANGDMASFQYGPAREVIKQVIQRSSGTVTTTRLGAYEKIQTNANGVSSLRERYHLGPLVITVEDGDFANPVEHYLFTDVLGSVVAATNTFGQITERHRFDPWGRPREALEWLLMGDAAWASIDRSQLATGKGFTGHEMIDVAGIIHMGGRIYDPSLGRFMSPDPVIAMPDYVDAYNRYSYVINSPLSYTDPSGYFLKSISNEVRRFGRRVRGEFSRFDSRLRAELSRFDSKYRYEIRGVLTLGIEPTLRYAGKELSRFAARNKFAGQILGVVGIVGCSFTTVAAPACLAAFQGATATAMAYGSGAKFEQALRGGLKASALAYTNAKVAGWIKVTAGGISNKALQALTKGVMHGARGGTFSALQGGDFRSGFMGAAAEGALATYIGHWGEANPAAGVAVSAMVSGAASSAVGGNFWDGAEQGAMGYLFNYLGAAAAKRAEWAAHGRAQSMQAAAVEGSAPYAADLALDSAKVGGGIGQIVLGAFTCYATVGVACAGGAAMMTLGARDIYHVYSGGEDMLVQPLVANGLISSETGQNMTQAINYGSAVYGVRSVNVLLHSGKFGEAAINAAPVITSFGID